MKPSPKICAGLLTSLILAMQVCCAEQISLTVRVDEDSYEGKEFWVGLFQSPLTPSSEALSWNHVKSKELSLQLAKHEDYVLVALQKGRIPITKPVAPRTSEDKIAIEIEFEKGKTLRGTILSADEFPIANANVAVERKSGLRVSQFPDASLITWASDKDGKVEISGLEPGDYEIAITPRLEFPRSVQHIEIRADAPKTQTKTLWIPTAYFLAGVVVDTGGKECEDVEVVASAHSATETEQGISLASTTDAEGTFAIGPFLKGRPVRLLAQTPDHRFSYGNLVYTGRQNLTLILQDSLQLRGKVVDADTRDPLEEFIVRVVAETGASTASEDAYRTETFVFEGIDGLIDIAAHWKTQQITVAADSYSPRTIELRGDAETVHDIGTIALRRSLDRVVFRLVDEDTRLAIGDASVALTIHTRDDSSSRIDTSWARVVTNNSGEFAVNDLPRHDVEIEVHTPSYQATRIRVDKSQQFLEIRCRRANATIRGVVQRFDGLPLVGQVRLDCTTVGSNTRERHWVSEDGTFEIAAPDGQFQLQAYSIEDGASAVHEVAVQDQSVVDDLILTIEPGGVVLGTVHGLEHAETIDLFVVDKENVFLIRRKEGLGNGTFSIGGLADGTHSIRAVSSMDRSIIVEVDMNQNGIETHLDLDFEGSSRLHGKVTVAGSPIARSQVIVVPRDGHGVRGKAVTQDDGSYEIHGLRDGEFVVTTKNRKFDVLVAGDTQFDAVID